MTCINDHKLHKILRAVKLVRVLRPTTTIAVEYSEADKLFLTSRNTRQIRFAMLLSHEQTHPSWGSRAGIGSRTGGRNGRPHKRTEYASMNAESATLLPRLDGPVCPLLYPPPGSTSLDRPPRTLVKRQTHYHLRSSTAIDRSRGEKSRPTSRGDPNLCTMRSPATKTDGFSQPVCRVPLRTAGAHLAVDRAVCPCVSPVLPPAAGGRQRRRPAAGGRSGEIPLSPYGRW